MLTGLIIDLAIVLIVLISVIISAKRGFMRTLIEAVGFVAAFFIAFTISSPLADMTYDNMIGPSIVSKVTEASHDTSSTVSSKIWDYMPEIIKNNPSTFGIEESKVKGKIESYTDIGAGDNAEKISENVTKPDIAKLISAIYSIVIIVVLIILSKLLAKLLNKLVSFSLVGKINTALGGALGAVKGIATAFLLCILISFIVITAKTDFGVFTAENIEATHLFKIFYGYSPFV